MYSGWNSGIDEATNNNDDYFYDGGWTPAEESDFYGEDMGHTWEDAGSGGWDGMGGYTVDDGMGGYDYYDVNGNYQGNDY